MTHSNKSVCLVELTACFDTLLHEAAAGRKESKNLEIVYTFQNTGYEAKLITVEVLQGLLNISGFEVELNKTGQCSQEAIAGSFRVWYN